MYGTQCGGYMEGVRVVVMNDDGVGKANVSND